MAGEQRTSNLMLRENQQAAHIRRLDVRRLDAELARLLAVFDLDDAWPLPDVLEKLIEATEHLLAVHSCDTHGHESYQYAVQRGRAILSNVRTALGEQPVETTGEQK